MNDINVLTQLINVIFHPNPMKDIVHYWINGEGTRRLISMSKFQALVASEQRDSLPKVIDACRTCSFYLWNLPEKLVVKLAPHSSREDERDPIGKRVFNAMRGIPEAPQFKKEILTMEDYLNAMGFETPTEVSTKNLQVTLSTKEKEKAPGFFSKIFRKRS